MGVQKLTGAVAKVGNLAFANSAARHATQTLRSTIARTDTAAKLLGTLPLNAVVVGLRVLGAAVSNAGTTATIGVGTTTAANEILSGFDVKGSTGAGQQVPAGVAGGFGAQGGATIYGKYAETGAASSSGGPWTVEVDFYE